MMTAATYNGAGDGSAAHDNPFGGRATAISMACYRFQITGEQLGSVQLVPQTTVSPSEVPHTTVSPSDVPHTTVSPSDVPHTTVSPPLVPHAAVSPPRDALKMSKRLVVCQAPHHSDSAGYVVLEGAAK